MLYIIKEHISLIHNTDRKVESMNNIAGNCICIFLKIRLRKKYFSRFWLVKV